VDGKAAWQWDEPEDLPSWTYYCFDSRGIGSDNQHTLIQLPPLAVKYNAWSVFRTATDSLFLFSIHATVKVTYQLDCVMFVYINTII
jgi:hypothetical protein